MSGIPGKERATSSHKLFREFSSIAAKTVEIYDRLDQREELSQALRTNSILRLCPADSVFKDAALITSRDTDLPPSLTYFALHTRIGASLTQEGFLIRLPDGQKIYPNLWVICLASSGAGKTFGRSKIAEKITECLEPLQVPESLTAAYLFDFLVGNGPDREKYAEAGPDDLARYTARCCAGLFVRDEMSEWFKRVNSGNDAMAELKDYLLRCYDGDPLTRATLKDKLRKTGRVSLSAYGTSVQHTFFSSIREEDFSNGLMQRFLLVLSDDRPDHRIALYQLHDIDAASSRFKSQWERAINGPREYRVTQDAIRVFTDWFQATWKQAPDQESYIRRYGFAAFKYALVLRACSEPDGVIDSGTMQLALQVIDLHLSDLYNALKNYTSVSGWHTVYKRLISYLEKHPEATRSKVLQNCADIGPSRNLDEFLTTIADAYGSEHLGTHAKTLLKQSRTWKARDAR